MRYFCMKVSKKSKKVVFLRKKCIFLPYFFTLCKSFDEKSRILHKKVRCTFVDFASVFCCK